VQDMPNRDLTMADPCLSRRWAVLVTLVAPINFLMSLDRHAISIAMPLIRHDFGFSVMQASFILSCTTWGYSLLQVPSGWLAERLGPRLVLFAACFAWSAATAISPLCAGFLPFMLARFVMGAAQAPDWSNSLLVLKRWFPQALRARANSVLLGFIYLGSIVSGPLTGWLMLSSSWKVAFVVFGLGGVVVSFYWGALYRDPPAEPPCRVAAGARDPAPPPRLLLLRQPRFWLCGALYFCTICVQGFYASWFPTYLHEVYHIRLSDLGWVSSAPWACLYLCVIAAGLLSDRLLRAYRSLWLARVVPGASGLLLSSVLLACSTRVSDIPVAIALMAACLGALGFVQVSLWSGIQDISGQYTGFVTGCTAFWGSLSASIVPLLVGGLVHWTGSWSDVLLIPAAAAGLGAFGFLGLRPQTPLLRDASR
jgi:MFS family permease